MSISPSEEMAEARKNEEGVIREYVINSYQMAAVNGRYYLSCNYDNVSNYRLERITDIKIAMEQYKER